MLQHLHELQAQELLKHSSDQSLGGEANVNCGEMEWEEKCVKNIKL